MSEQQSVAAAAEAAPPPPAAGEDPGYDRQEAIGKMVSMLEHSAKEGDDSGEASETAAEGEQAGEETPKKPPEPEKKEFSVDATREKLTEVLNGLSDDQIEQVLGATNDAFAALTAKSRRLRERTENFLRAQQAFDAEKAEHAELKQEFDQELIAGRKNPLKALELFGWTLADAHAFVTNGEELPISKQLELQREELRQEMEKKLSGKTEEQTKAQIEAERAENERRWQHGVLASIRENVSADKTPNLAWYVERYGEAALQKAVIGMQTKVFEHFKGKKILDERTALAQIEADEDLAALRRGYVAKTDPGQQGAVKSAKTEAGREPSPSLSASATGERHLPPSPDPDEEDLSREARVKRMVAIARQGQQ